MKMTDWFGPWQTPVRAGWYELLMWLEDEPLSVALSRLERAFFDGREWVDGLSPRMAWRGLADYASVHSVSGSANDGRLWTEQKERLCWLFPLSVNNLGA